MIRGIIKKKTKIGANKGISQNNYQSINICIPYRSKRESEVSDDIPSGITCSRFFAAFLNSSDYERTFPAINSMKRPKFIQLEVLVVQCPALFFMSTMHGHIVIEFTSFLHVRLAIGCSQRPF